MLNKLFSATVFGLQCPAGFSFASALFKILNHCLESVMGWMKADKLKLNPVKAEVLLVSRQAVEIWNHCLGSATDWTKASKFKLNLDKTEVLLVRRPAATHI